MTQTTVRAGHQEVTHGPGGKAVARPHVLSGRFCGCGSGLLPWGEKDGQGRPPTARPSPPCASSGVYQRRGGGGTNTPIPYLPF